MTDEELCAALRVSQWDVRQKAADRIEALVRERDELQQKTVPVWEIPIQIIEYCLLRMVVTTAQDADEKKALRLWLSKVGGER